MEKVSVMQQQWDYLIVLDACRFDYFEQVWNNYLQGDLTKKMSVGTGTTEWRNKSFTDYYGDVIYISANPYINSLVPAKGFLAKDYFYKVYDLWQEDWNNEKGTVLPEVVTKRATDIINATPDKRAIIHYIQPHEPYLGPTVAIPGYQPPIAGGYLQGLRGECRTIRKVMNIVNGLFYWLGIRGNFLSWHLRQFLGLSPAGPMDAVRRKYGNEILRQAYKENLEIVLKHAAELVDNLSGRIVITADHGEMLGENGCYCHWSRSSNKFLVEIPWLVIDKGKKVTEPARQTTDKEPQPTKPASDKADEQTKKQIQEKLRALGYFD